jgi:metal-sulfur cluster biosynthetic enzyme
MASKEEIVEVLKTVEDPELFLDIWFLGLIYSIDIDEELVTIEMTFTTPTCPAGPELVSEIKSKVSALEGVQETIVRVVFNPPWLPPEEVKEFLGIM